MALISLIGLLGAIAVAWWLLDRGARGAEIATVLEPAVEIFAVILSALMLVVALSKPEAGSDGKGTSKTEKVRKSSKSWWTKVVGRIRSHRLPVVITGLLLVLIVATTPAWKPRLNVLLTGCGHATELRVLASQDGLEPARLLAERYQRSTMWNGCADVHPYVYALPTAKARETIAAGWPDLALRDAGPRPDVWLAESAWEVTQARTDGADAIAADDAVGWSPIVLGLPPSGASEQDGGLEDHPWPELVELTASHDWGLVRPDPASSPAGELATALLYGTAPADQTARMIEQRVGSALDRDGYPLAGSLAVLCHYRQLNPPRTAVITSEQALARFNNGDPLGGECRVREGQRTDDLLLRAYYPPDTRGLDHRLVRFTWSSARQANAAAGFGRWLATEDGARALAAVGLRTPDASVEGGLLTARNGVRPDVTVNPEPVPADVLTAAAATHRKAQRRSRVLLALDSSGSMSTSTGAGQGTRFAAAGDAVVSALNLMGVRDEFGLWIFPPGQGGPGWYGEVVAVGPRDGPDGGASRLAAIDAALNGIRPGGNTPLYRAIAAGVGAVGSSNDEVSSALVVLTDGKDTSSGLTGREVIDAVAGKGVRIFVVAFGEASCATGVLGEITTSTGGRCLHSDPLSIDARLAELFAVLWS